MNEKESQVTTVDVVLSLIFFMIIIFVVIPKLFEVGKSLLFSANQVNAPQETVQVIPTGIKETTQSNQANPAPWSTLRRMTARDYVLGKSSAESTIISKESYNEGNW